MKKLFSSVLAALGMQPAAHVEPSTQMVDPKTIMFSMPTVAADDVEFAMPTEESFQGAPQFHEDEWCQVEFFPRGQFAEIQRRLVEYKAFEEKHRVHNGWNNIYARRIPREGVVQGSDAPSAVATSVGAVTRPSPILTTSSGPLGQVKGGFTLELPGSVLLYGLTTTEGISTLGATVARGGDDTQLTQAYMTLFKKYGLLLVDWRAQLLLQSVDERGDISVWRP
ncbi:hypothetical protein [Cupriavidus pauculus]|uniref:hypothetical protein n=1 Tax=Cupriavidus pauculus TaxID=82633 RepID=UPI001FD181D0|nr:hypothetical protein [Cupriavidus pauculus]